MLLPHKKSPGQKTDRGNKSGGNASLEEEAVFLSAKGRSSAQKTGLRSELWIGFDACIRTVETELFFFFADTDADS